MRTEVENSSCINQLKNLIEAKVPYIWVTTYEEKRFIEEFYVNVSEALRKDLYSWSNVRGFEHWASAQDAQKNRSGSIAADQLARSEDPMQALHVIEDTKPAPDRSGVIFILKDFHVFMNQAVPRILRDNYDGLSKSNKTIIFVSPSIGHGPGGTKPGLEPTLDKQITVLEYDLPTREYIRSKLNAIIERMQASKAKTTSNPKVAARKDRIKTDYTPEEIESCVSALQGLTELEADNAIYTSIQSLNRLDEQHLLLEKQQVIKRSDILEYIQHAPELNDIGGLDEIKAYIDMYKDQFAPEAEEFGVEPLRGIIFTGIPGTGKSLSAKAVAALWKLPLLRLDVGKVMTGLVGGSEEKMRHVINQVEAVAPCVLWIDEIEKSLSGTQSSNFSDGGTLSRVFGTLLTAMEERFKGVVTIATANDINALPAELIRRFNELFFVDLPEPTERQEIFEIHLRKRKRDVKELNLDMQALVNATNKYTGSEIEKVITEAIMRSFRDGRRPLTTADLLGAIQDTKPIANVMADKINALREWARDRARYASSLAAQANASGKQRVVTKSGKELNVADALDGLAPVKSKQAKATEKSRLDGVLDN